MLPSQVQGRLTVSHYGFIGLGIMGSAMASNLLSAGHTVTVWNRDPTKSEALAERGAHVATSPSEVVAAASVTFSMVSDPAATREVVFGGRGVLAGVGPGHDYVETSTIDDVTSREVADAVAARGGRYLEAPVTGTKKPAQDGQLVFLCAGDESLYRQVQPALEAMGKQNVFLGEVGNGARMKLVINAMMGSVMAALAEGVALADRAGLDSAQFLELLDAGVLASPLVRSKGPQLLSNDHPASFPLKHMQKDLRLALSLADTVAQPLPALTTVNEVYERALKLGFGDQDLSAVYRVVRAP